MPYTCQNCGATADNANSLCKPTNEELDSKFCGVPTDQVCNEKLTTIKYTCDSCGSVSVDAERLCNPSMVS